MKYDISALGNALVDTQYKVSHEFLSSVGLEADSMTQHLGTHPPWSGYQTLTLHGANDISV